MDLWVAGRVVEVAAGWARAGHALQVSLNLSAQGLGEGYRRPSGLTCVVVAGLEPPRLTVELLESIRRVPELMPEIEKLGRIGVRLAIDDFGTGYSSLDLLHTPGHSVKIDGVFVADIENDAGSRLDRPGLGVDRQGPSAWV